MATYPSIPACRIPRTEEAGRLQSIALQRVRHNWSNLACTLASMGGEGRDSERRYGNAKILRQSNYDSTMAFLLIPDQWKQGWVDGMELKKQGGPRHHSAWLAMVISFCILFSFQQEDTEDIYLGCSICFKSSPIIPSLGGIKNSHTKTTCGFHPSFSVSHCFRRQQDKLKSWQRT